MKTCNLYLEKFPQFAAAITGIIGVASGGMNYAWTAPALSALEKDDSHIHISETDHIWIETIYFIGCLISIPITIYAVDKIGRKQTLIISAVISLVSWLLIGIADDATYLYVARFIVGFAGVINFISGPIYIAEISDKHIRGFLAALVYIMFIAGILVIYSIVPFFAFYVPSIVGSSLIVTQLVLLPFMPDSPYYLIMKGNTDKAREHLKRLRRRENVESELKEIIDTVNRQENQKGKLQDLLIIESNRKGVLIMLMLNCGQHFSGLSVFLMNMHDILEEANSIYLSKENTGICFAALMLLGAIITDFHVDRLGRKRLLILSCCLSSLSLLTLAVYFTLQKLGNDVSGISWLPVVAMMTYGFVFELGLGIVPIVLTAELFPSNVKTMGMSIADLIYVIFAWVSVEVYLSLSTWIGFDVPFYIFSVCTIITAIFTYIYIPETKGKTLDEIQFMLKDISPPSLQSGSTIT